MSNGIRCDRCNKLLGAAYGPARAGDLPLICRCGGRGTQQKRQWVEPVEYDATVQQYRPVKVDHAAMRDEKHATDDARAYPTSLEQWMPISAPTMAGSFKEPGRPLRITLGNSELYWNGVRVTADSSLRKDECYVIAQPAVCGVGSTHHSHKCQRPAGHADVHVVRGCSWGADAVDPLDVEYDGLRLRELLVADEVQRRGECSPHVRFTPAQRAAVSAHWSAELRAKVAAAKELERNRVSLGGDGE